ncbi:MAG: glucose-6-phosphate isomerase [Oscillospiraceae bacterium]|nr:glucose-6-phosphate isomerase [Oscillospiraceae bacterium]MBR0452212.1 glucose-6-phosphate isomerase [Oscillospiraceae bacterium]
MIRYNTGYLKNFISNDELVAISPEVLEASRVLREGTGAGNDFLGWRDLPVDFDKEEYSRIKAAAKRIRETSDIFIVIGIGGSYLGARAVLELLLGESHNELSRPRVYFAGNSISATDLADLLKICETGEVSVNVISKSGTTTEPAVAFRTLRNYLIRRYGEDEAAKRIIATTDKARGTLKKLSDEQGYETFVVPDDVGGRFSVLTAVGLLPLAVAGIDTDALLQGAADYRTAIDLDDTLDNPSNLYAAVRNILYRKGKNVEVLSCFEPRFRMMGEWYKQLFGESEGKEKKGIYPSSALFTTDLHSMGQYVQDGSRFLFETLVSFLETGSELAVNKEEVDFDGLNYLAGKTLEDINQVASDATLRAHVEGGVPCSIIEVERMDAYNLGELIYFMERACAVSGYVLGVNPFNQPGVETYKRNMFALLDKPGYEEDKKNLLK